MRSPYFHELIALGVRASPGMDWIDTEHLLLGLLHTRDSMGCLIVHKFDVNPLKLYNQVGGVLVESMGHGGRRQNRPRT